MAVVAQRLIRVLCNYCKEPIEPDYIALEGLGVIPDKFKDTTIYKAKGCEKCFNTGYKGRMAIFEIMVLNSKLKSLVLKTYANRIKNEALNQNMITLRQDGIQKVLEGITTIEEVLRVTQQ